MNASVAHRWRNAEMLVLAPLYGKQTNAVLSRVARKPVRSCRLSPGIPITRRQATAAKAA